MAVCPDLPVYVRLRLDDSSLEVDVSKDCSINDLFIALSTQGIEVLSMRNKTNRLEQLFMNLVDSNDAQRAHA